LFSVKVLSGDSMFYQKDFLDSNASYVQGKGTLAEGVVSAPFWPSNIQGRKGRFAIRPRLALTRQKTGRTSAPVNACP